MISAGHRTRWTQTGTSSGVPVWTKPGIAADSVGRSSNPEIQIPIMALNPGPRQSGLEPTQQAQWPDGFPRAAVSQQSRPLARSSETTRDSLAGLEGSMVLFSWPCGLQD